MLIAVCAVLASGCGSSESPEPVDSVAAMGFVEKFAPLVRLPADEELLPMTAADFIGHSRLVWTDGLGRRTTVATGAEIDGAGDPQLDPVRLTNSDQGVYSKRLGGRAGCPDCDTRPATAASETRPFQPGRYEKYLRPGEGFSLDLAQEQAAVAGTVAQEGEQTVLRGAPAYTEVVEEGNPRDLVRVIYWMLFGSERSSSGQPREGDWERVSVLLRKADRGASYEPVHVRYYQRGRHHDVPWKDVEIVEAGPGEVQATHPVVYLNRGDHTPRPEPAGGQAQSCPRCPEWTTWRQLVNVDTEPWYSFGGAWGRAGASAERTGPPGPSIYVDH